MATEGLPYRELDNDGFLEEMSSWTRDVATELARRNDPERVNDSETPPLRV